MSDTNYATDLPEGLVMLEEYPGYGVTRDGDVWRTTKILRGRYAGDGPSRLRPSIHPRGHQWYVHVRGHDGTRSRVAVKRLMRAAFGS
jgi:hypothetical protein